MQMKHPAWTAAARTSLAVVGQHLLAVEEVEGLVQDGFRKAELGMVLFELLEQS